METPLCWTFLILLELMFTLGGTVPRRGGDKDVADLAVALDNSCYDMNAVPHLGQIPDSSDCQRFLECTEIFEGIPTGVPTPCGDSLFYDIESCTCTVPSSAECYDSSNPDHENNRFKCAEPLRLRTIVSSTI